MTAELDLSYHKRFPNAYVPEAYEKLIHDCLLGQHANFVRDDELRESWSEQANRRWNFSMSSGCVDLYNL